MSDQPGDPYDPQYLPPPQYQPGSQYQPGAPYPAGSQYPSATDQYGWGPTPYPAAPPAEVRKRRRVHPAFLIVGGIVVAALVVGVLVAVLAKGDVVDAPGTDGRSLAIPATIDGYRPVPGVDTENIKANLAEELARKSDDDPKAIESSAAVGVFQQRTSGARVVFVGIALRDVSSLRSEMHSDGVESTLKFFMAGVGTSYGAGRASTRFSPGPLKGFLRCSKGKIDGTPASVCGWGDESAIALTIFTETQSLPDAAAGTRALRSAIERR